MTEKKQEKPDPTLTIRDLVHVGGYLSSRHKISFYMLRGHDAPEGSLEGLIDLAIKSFKRSGRYAPTCNPLFNWPVFIDFTILTGNPDAVLITNQARGGDV